tara:strand:- start:1125 stop:1262 length:138 start_codon:yes stop_codon:yes gene_type:complete
MAVTGGIVVKEIKVIDSVPIVVTPGEFSASDELINEVLVLIKELE